MSRLILLPLLLVPLAFADDPAPKALRQMEALGRGIVAIHHAEGKVFVSWRLLGTDPDGIASVAWQNVGYNQPPHPSYFLGDGMKEPLRGRIKNLGAIGR